MAVAPPPGPGVVGDDDLSNLLMAWYYSGYYTGYYQVRSRTRPSSVSVRLTSSVRPHSGQASERWTRAVTPMYRFEHSRNI
jgi:hypothetical protein